MHLPVCSTVLSGPRSSTTSENARRYFSTDQALTQLTIASQAHGLEEVAAALAEELGENVPDLPDLSDARLFSPPNPIFKGANWPLLETRKSILDMLDQDEEVPPEQLEEEVAQFDEDDGSEVEAGDDWGGLGDIGVEDAEGAGAEEGGGG